MRRIALLCLTAAACAAAVADSASAQVQPAGTGEPAFTNSVQNTQWFEWPATSGADAYRIRFDYYENNTLKASPVVNLPSANSGSNWANWSGVATLQHGGQYGVCAQGQYSFPNDPLFFPDGPNSCSMGTMLGRRAHTTIDRSKPTATLQLAADAAYTRDTKIPVRIDFADDVAGPFPANFLCFEVGVGPDNLCDTNARQDLRAQPGLLGPRERRQVDHVHLHGRLRRDRGRQRVGLRDRGRRVDPGQPERAEPERHGRQGQPVPAQLRRRGARSHAADGRDRRGLDRR